MEKKLVILELSDGEFKDLALISTSLSENQLQEEANKILKKWKEKKINDWSYLDLLEELEKRKIVEIVHCETYNIFA